LVIGNWSLVIGGRRGEARRGARRAEDCPPYLAGRTDGWGEEGREVLEAETGPGFVTGGIVDGAGDGDEFRTDNAGAAAGDVFGGQAHEVDDAKMDAANVGAVVVDRGHGRDMAGINGDLFHEFTAHALLITAVVGEKAVILLGDVAADTDGIEAVQAGFLAALAAAVTENLAVADQEDVGDKLLVTLVLFGAAAV